MFQPNGISLHVRGPRQRQARGLATRMLAFVTLRDGCVHIGKIVLRQESSPKKQQTAGNSFAQEGLCFKLLPAR